MDTEPSNTENEKNPKTPPNLRRQLVLYHVHGNEGTLTLRELSRKVAASEVDRASGSVTGDESNAESGVEDIVADVYDSLYRMHIPILVDQGILEYDEETNSIRPTDQLEDVRGVELDTRTQRHRQALYYAIPSVILAGLIVALGSGFVQYPNRALWWITLAGATTLLLVALYRTSMTSDRSIS